jgi:hypothetical protein
VENRAWYEPTERFSHFVDLSLTKTITPNTPWSEPSAFQPVDQRGFLEPDFSCRSHLGSHHKFAHEKSGLASPRARSKVSIST